MSFKDQKVTKEVQASFVVELPRTDSKSELSLDPLYNLINRSQLNSVNRLDVVQAFQTNSKNYYNSNLDTFDIQLTDQYLIVSIQPYPGSTQSISNFYTTDSTSQIIFTQRSTHQLNLARSVLNLEARIENNDIIIQTYSSNENILLWCTKEIELCDTGDQVKNLNRSTGVKLKPVDSIDAADKIFELLADKNIKKYKTVQQLIPYTQISTNLFYRDGKVLTPEKIVFSGNIKKVGRQYILTEAGDLLISERHVDQKSQNKNNFAKFDSDVSSVFEIKANPSTIGIVKSNGDQYIYSMNEGRYKIPVQKSDYGEIVNVCFYKIFATRNVEGKYTVFEINDFGNSNKLENIGVFEDMHDCYFKNSDSKVFHVEQGVSSFDKSQLKPVIDSSKFDTIPYSSCNYSNISLSDNSSTEGYLCRNGDKLEYTESAKPYTSVNKLSPPLIQLLSKSKVQDVYISYDNDKSYNLVLYQDGSSQTNISDFKLDKLNLVYQNAK